jgi:hypothetical protein
MDSPKADIIGITLAGLTALAGVLAVVFRMLGL